MTRRQRIEHKIGNQFRKAALLKAYYKVKPSVAGFIAKPGFIQDGKYTPR